MRITGVLLCQFGIGDTSLLASTDRLFSLRSQVQVTEHSTASVDPAPQHSKSSRHPSSLGLNYLRDGQGHVGNAEAWGWFITGHSADLQFLQ